MAAIMSVLPAIRAVMEERLLGAQLDGYSEYTVRVRYRLIPMIW